MAVFLIISLLSFFAALFLQAAVKYDVAENGVARKMIVAGNWLEIKISTRILASFAFAFFLLVFVLIIYFCFSYILPINHGLYEWEELLTSYRFEKGTYGFIFGSLLGVWFGRHYRRRPEASLTFVEKIEGAVLAILFIVGLADVSFNELLRNFHLKEGQLSFSLQTQNIANDNESAPTDDGQNGSGDFSDFRSGFLFIENSSILEKRDFTYAREYPVEDTFTGNVSVTRNYEVDSIIKHTDRVFSCIKTLTEASGNNGLLEGRLGVLRHNYGALHKTSMRLHGMQTGSESGQQALKPIIEYRNKIKEELTNIDEFLENISGICKPTSTNGQSQNTTQQAKTNEEERWKTSPYFAIIYASLLQGNNQRLEAIQVLLEKLDQLEEIIGEGSDDPLDFWYLMRTYNVVFILFQDYIDNEGKLVPDRINNIFFNYLDRYMGWIKRLDQSIPKSHFFPLSHVVLDQSKRFSQRGFSENSPFKYKCPEHREGQKFKDRTIQIYSYIFLGLQAIYVERIAHSGKLNEEERLVANAMANSIVDTDLSCAIEFLDKKQVILQRAEFLYIYSNYQYKMAKLRKVTGFEYYNKTRRQIDKARNAAKLARGLLSISNESLNKVISTSKQKGAYDREKLKEKLDRLIYKQTNWLKRL